MTVLIGFSFRDLTVLGADSRGIADNDRDDVVDDMQKLYKTGFGLMAGAGRSDVVETVTQIFANHAPASNQDASNMIRAEIMKLRLPPDDPALLKTCWLATYATSTEAGPVAQLALVSRDLNYELGRWPHDDFLVINPAGFSDELSRSLDAEARWRFNKHIVSAQPAKRLELCVQMIDGLVKTVAQHNETVSSRWSVGFHDATRNETRISNICTATDGIEWR